MKNYFLSVGFILLSALAIAQSGKMVAEKSGKGAVIIHEVQPKEGLYSLSRMYNVKVADIANANGFDKDKNLTIGQKVKIPLTSENLSASKTKTPVYYTVSNGESLGTISNRFNKIPVKELKTINKISGNDVEKGKEIIVGYFTGTASTATAMANSNNDSKEVKRNGSQAVITGTNINIRKGPATDAPVIGTAQQYDIVTFLKKVNADWVLIRTGDGNEGYIASQFLQVSNTSNKIVAENSNKVVSENKLTKAKVSGSNINIRKGPATDQPVVGTAQLEDIVTVIKKVNADWSQIRTKDGAEGYVASQFLVAPDAKLEPKAPITVKSETAKISGANVNIRKGPSTDEPVVGAAQQEDIVTVSKKVNAEWTAIRTANGTEGFVASQFLVAPDTKLEPAKKIAAPAVTAKISGTNINIRKGPSTDQPVVATAQQDDNVTVLQKVDADWSQVKLSDGTEGFVASRFLAAPGEDNNAATNSSDDKIDNVVNKVDKELTANKTVEEAPQQLPGSGFFKEGYKTGNASTKTLTSGIFKTDKGWDDGKYYLLMDNATNGSIVKITNPENNKIIYAKVLGKMKGLQYSDGFDMRISDAAASQLQTSNTEKFNLKVNY